jgi:hypothetical protein
MEKGTHIIVSEKEIINMIIDEIMGITKMLDEAPPEMIGRARAYYSIDAHCMTLRAINQNRKGN